MPPIVIETLLAVVVAVLLLLLIVGYTLQQRHLRRRREIFSCVTENISEGLLMLDNKGCLVTYNAAAVRLLGIEAVEKLEKQTLDTIEDIPLKNVVLAALGGENDELLLQLGDKPCQLLARPVRDKEKIIGAVLLLLDITEKEAREKLRREFTANVSHELKTPLTSISGFAEIIRDGIAKEEDVGRFANNIYSESQRLITLVEDIIKLSRLDDTTAPAERREVDMQELIRTVLNHLLPLAQAQQVTLDTRTDPITVYGVPRILEEIVFNLCENAIKYNRPGGRVTVTMKYENDRPALCVHDTGIGIAPAEQERVFERFYRVDKSHSRAIGGTGLGLSIVKHGVLYHGGTVKLESRPGVGTAITVVFPK